MAEKKRSNNLTDKADPTITSDVAGPAYPEGTHPLAPLSEQYWAAGNKEYRDVPDGEKPVPGVIAQEEVPRD